MALQLARSREARGHRGGPAPAARPAVASEPLLGEWRALFGDERASYADALDRHYRLGAPEDWADTFISEYATMHPWEDFAETFAHYLHITGTLATAAVAGVVLDSDRIDDVIQHDVVPAAARRLASGRPGP